MPHVLMIARAIVEENADTAAAIHAAGTAKVQVMQLAAGDATHVRTFATVVLAVVKETVAAAVPQHPQDNALIGWEV